MSDLTRRGFVKNSAAATAGMTVIGALLAGPADAHKGGDGSKAVLAYVRDARKGDIAILTGDREVHVHDRRLAEAIAHAAR
jgi:anaerobic selenocysteine-containing dehydrogenase